MRRKFMLHKSNLNFPKVRFTYIKLTQNFGKQCVPNFILHKFAAMQISQHTYLKEKRDTNVNGNFTKKD